MKVRIVAQIGLHVEVEVEADSLGDAENILHDDMCVSELIDNSYGGYEVIYVHTLEKVE
jgi:hypothetical protein